MIFHKGNVKNNARQSAQNQTKILEHSHAEIEAFWQKRRTRPALAGENEKREKADLI
jgi:hypothetical protein